jgi:hypothetical protein
MKEFADEFLPGFAWLVAHRFAFVEMKDGLLHWVGGDLQLTEEQVRTFPAAAQLAYHAFRDSMAEIRSKEGGTGMDDLFRLLQTPVIPAVLFSAMRGEPEHSDDAE